MNIATDSVVTLHYTLKDETGATLDSSDGGEPLAYLHGHGQLVPGLERELEGKTAGTKLHVEVSAADGYGEYDENLIQRVPNKAFRNVPKLEVGMQLHSETPQGVRTITVKKIAADYVLIDGNHPLAGKALAFDIDIQDVRAASEEELTHGHVHGEGGHHH